MTPENAIRGQALVVYSALHYVYFKDGRATVTTVCARLGWSRDTVHRYLTQLRELGLVRYGVDGALAPLYKAVA